MTLHPDGGGATKAVWTPRKVILARARLWLMFDDIVNTLRGLGTEVIVLHLGEIDVSDIRDRLRAEKPDLLLSINYIEGMSELCAAAEVPYVVWEIDPRMWISPTPAQSVLSWVHIFTYRRKNLARFAADGFPHVHHLPLAAATERYTPLELTPNKQQRFSAPISFVGASLVLPDQEQDLARARAALARKIEKASSPEEKSRWGEGLRALRDALDAQQRDLLNPVFCEMLEESWGALGLPTLLDAGERRMDLKIVYERSFGTRRRCRILQEVQGFGAVVYGDAGWRTELPPRVAYMGEAEHRSDLGRIYCASDINLDIGRLYQLDIVTLRIFDILACQAFVLAEHSDELDSLFDVGREVVAYKGLKELREAASYYLEHADEREGIARRGRERVLREHTIEQRLMTIFGTMRTHNPGATQWK